ncbi:vq motif-containing protein [Abeliophyllum distichum]|uniref:Vq motif-containing protein n=1 Tax=Abeliophyllum distichum TaxID=126358 RepID=A0ABD1SWC3_9LAMI
MDAYSYTYPQQVEKKSKQLTGFRTELHSVRKVSSKPMKKPIAPFPPIPQKIYKVDPVNFREVVQRLTGLEEEVAHPPLSFLRNITTKPRPPLVYPSQVVAETEEGKSLEPFDAFGALSHLSFSPSSLAMYSSLLSPRTISSLAPTTLI